MDETKILSGYGTSPPSDEGRGGFTLGDPATIGRYRIIRRLGQGGFGTVYLAHDDELDRPVAIKVPNPERIEHPEDVEAYLNEARILARLDHPSIVPVYDVGRTEDGLCFVVSKLVEGSDLAVKIEERRLSFRDSAELVAIVAEALHYAHTRGSSTGTSSPPTSSSMPRASPVSPTSGSPSETRTSARAGGWLELRPT
jgi:serine/threonine protein kinase